MIMAWLVNSMEEEISVSYMCYPTAKDLWDNATLMYSDLGNQSQTYEIQLELGEACKSVRILSLNMSIFSKAYGMTFTYSTMTMGGRTQMIVNMIRRRTREFSDFCCTQHRI